LERENLDLRQIKRKWEEMKERAVHEGEEIGIAERLRIKYNAEIDELKYSLYEKEENLNSLNR
jgi:hypothetical protein